MLDLSNNNGPVDFRRVYQAGQRRVYLKKTEGLGFDDRKFWAFRAAAQAHGLKTGAYHFGRPENDPVREAHHFCDGLVLKRGKDLRPCLDFEIGRPDARWARTFIREVQRITGVQPIIYSYADFLRRAGFSSAPAPLWLASYGRNDGREYPFQVPSPWRGIVAHQFSSNCRVAGCSERVDVSHVFDGRALNIPLWRRH